MTNRRRNANSDHRDKHSHAGHSRTLFKEKFSHLEFLLLCLFIYVSVSRFTSSCWNKTLPSPAAAASATTLSPCCHPPPAAVLQSIHCDLLVPLSRFISHGVILRKKNVAIILHGSIDDDEHSSLWPDPMFTVAFIYNCHSTVLQYMYTQVVVIMST